MPASTTTRPPVTSVTPRSVGRRDPNRAASPPAIGAKMIIGAVCASMISPARSGL